MNRSILVVASLTRMQLRRVCVLALWIFPVLCCIALVGCKMEEKTQAQALAKRGVEVGDKLADYYSRLAKETERFSDLQNLELALKLDDKVEPLSASSRARVRAFKSRAAMAKSLSSVCTSLARLAGDDRAAEISGEFGKLLAEMIKVNESSKAICSEGKDALFVKAIDALVSLIQVQKFHKYDPRLAQIVNGIDSLYDNEKSAYVNCARDYESQRKNVAELLPIQNIMVLTGEFEDDVSPYGKLLQVPIVGNPELDEWRTQRAKRILQGRLEEAKAEANGHSNALFQMLRAVQVWAGTEVDYPLFKLASFNDVIGMEIYMREALKDRRGFEKLHPEGEYVPRDQLSDYLATRLGPSTQTLLLKSNTSLSSSGTTSVFISDLNRLLEASDLCGWLLDSLSEDLGTRIDQYIKKPVEESRPQLAMDVLTEMNKLLFKGRTDTRSAESELSLNESKSYIQFFESAVTPVVRVDASGREMVKLRRELLERAYPKNIGPDYPLFKLASFNDVIGMEKYVREALKDRRGFENDKLHLEGKYVPRDPLSDYLATRLGPNTQALLLKSDTSLSNSGTTSIFISDLNRLLETSDLCGWLIGSLPGDLQTRIDQYSKNQDSSVRIKLAADVLTEMNKLLFKGRSAESGLSPNESEHHIQYVNAPYIPVVRSRAMFQLGRELLERAYPKNIVGGK